MAPPLKPAVPKPVIAKAVLDSIDIRLGTILRVEDIAGSKRLVALVVDLGDHLRTIVVGLKGERADPRSLAGVQTLFVINLEPCNMHGVMSEGMLLDIGYPDGLNPALATPERPLPNGARLG